ncbi:hypothetical protein DFQ00_10383 [Paenibacillus barcinonensis]|uniref:Uncharacterized protein n=1 Tax=Paenibacillus barcinonensis TaxID=198119 RepID=A0A2V4VM50_PAEBA|nr:hypothetical protein DFQ00_10383 [Paenibacillus barcinonensis]
MRLSFFIWKIVKFVASLKKIAGINKRSTQFLLLLLLGGGSRKWRYDWF